jgi:hypothetical protein
VRRWGVTIYRIRFEGPAPLALRIATALADAEGVELISSEPPSTVNEGTVVLDVTVEGARDAVAGAVAGLRDDMPTGASIKMAGD